MPGGWLDQPSEVIDDDGNHLSIDPLQGRILSVFKVTRGAMDSLNRPYSKEELIQLYKRALDHGLDEQISEEQLKAIIKILITK